jgi:phosphatidylserine/phosphatidylglycerophosphate/cardiolipin synthase-like enzyme
MDDIIGRIEASITDKVLVSGEKKALKRLMAEKQLNKRELDFLRSKNFDIAKSNQETLSKENLIDWIETANKLTLTNNTLDTSDTYARFSPGNSCRNTIIQKIKSATSSVKICVFTVSDDQISKEIIACHKRGISVKLITDNDKCFDLGSDIERIEKNGIQVKIDSSPSHMHHKFCIIDKEVLITGSYNWTRSAAARNQENILVTTEKEVTKSYLREFEKLWENLTHY